MSVLAVCGMTVLVQHIGLLKHGEVMDNDTRKFYPNAHVFTTLPKEIRIGKPNPESGDQETHTLALSEDHSTSISFVMAFCTLEEMKDFAEALLVRVESEMLARQQADEEATGC